MTGLGLAFSQQMKMQQRMSPHLFQSLEILQMPLLDLQQMIQQELSENPTLEAAVEAPDAQIEVETGRTGDADEFDNEIEQLAALGEEWDGNPLAPSSGGEVDEKYQYMMDSLTEGASLQEQLLEQLGYAQLDERERAVAELMIGNIDDDGYLTLETEELEAMPSFPHEIFDKILGLIQSFEPAGVGARNLRECLLLQLERAGRKDSLEYQMVCEAIDLLGRHRYDEIAQQLNRTLDEVKAAAEEIARLDPKPGQSVSNEQSEYVTPEIIVEKIAGEYVVKQNRKPYPQLYINQKYLQMLKDPKTTKEVKKYIREKIAKSRHFIQSIDQRMDTIYRIACKIVRIQEDFFEYGVARLTPLNMRTVADALEVHETTVSRAISGKYMQTPSGLLSMKYFFTTGVKGKDGIAISNESIRASLAEIVAGENKKQPYSDAKLVALLEEQGIKIARRTVAKYRDQLRILPSHLRKTH